MVLPHEQYSLVPWSIQNLVHEAFELGWKLTTIDKVGGKYFSLDGDGSPIEFQLQSGNSVIQQQLLNAPKALTMPLAAQSRKITFRAVWAARHAFVDLREIQKKLKLMMGWDPMLSRPPRVRFVWGKLEPFDGYLEALPIKIPQLFPITNLPIFLDYQFTIIEDSPLIVDKTNPIAKEQETVYVQMVGGQTPEDVALDLYGDPNFGVLLRQNNPETLDWTANDTLKAYGRDHSRITRPILPQSPSFVDGFQATGIAIAQERITKGEVYDIIALELSSLESEVTSDAVWVWHDTPSLISGTKYQLSQPFNPGTTHIYVSGLRQILNDDYIEYPTLGQVEFSITPTGDIRARYEKEGATSMIVSNETPIGAIDGINTIYTLAFAYVSGAVELWANGYHLIFGDDFTETGPQQVTLAVALISGADLTATYERF